MFEPQPDALKHHLEICSSILTFLGGVVLAIDAFRAKSRANAETGQGVLLKIQQKKDILFEDEQGKPLSEGRYKLAAAQKTVFWTRLGFVLVAIGFALDLWGKLR